MQSRHYFHALFVACCLCVPPATAQQQLEQDTIVIKGDQELPGTLYIAPWKRVGTPLESGRLEGEVGEAREPLERDLFQRELELQREGYSTGQAPGAITTPGSASGTGPTH